MTRFKQFRIFFCRTPLTAALAVCRAALAKGGEHV